MKNSDKDLSMISDGKVRAYGMAVLVAAILAPPAFSVKGAAEGLLAFGLWFLSRWIFGASTMKKVGIERWLYVSVILTASGFLVANLANDYIDMVRFAVVVFMFSFLVKLIVNIRTLIPPASRS